MHSLLHIVSIVFLLPSLLVGLAFVFLGHAIAGVTIFQFFLRLIYEAKWFLTWGIYVIPALLLVILVGGFFIQTRWLAALTVALLSLASTLVIIILYPGPIPPGEWIYLLPGIVALSISSWLTYTEWP